MVAGATTFPPQAVGQQPVLTLEPLMSGMLYGALLCPRFCGGKVVPQAPKGEKPPEVADSPPCLERNADFISIARRAIHNPLNPLNLLNPMNPATQWLHGRYHNPLNPPAGSGQNLLNLLNPAAKRLQWRYHNPWPEGPSNLRTLRPKAGQS